MNILTLENTAFEMNELPDEVDDMRFCVLDNSNPKEPDYFFIPLIFLESFNAPAVVLRIGNQIIKMPIEKKWQILVGDEEAKDLDMVPLEDVNDRGFTAFTYNPLTDNRPSFNEVEVDDIYPDVRWFFPKLKPGQLLCVPIDRGHNPRCVYFSRNISRQCEMIDYSKAWQ